MFLFDVWKISPKLSRDYPYVYVDGVYLKRSWGGEIQNVSVLVAIGVSQDGCRESLGAAEGMKEDCESWRSFFVWLKERGLTGVRLIIGDKNLGMFETIPEVFPDARYQRRTVHFYRNIFSVTPRNKMKTVALMLKAIHAQESKEAAREKAIQVAGETPSYEAYQSCQGGRGRNRRDIDLYGFSYAALDPDPDQ